ncbi:MAG: Ig-like domain-containing protein [Paludibacteraceae bacterium]|nr:Ig-like domain-containing protein [Paludibacteraceae bacterium]
MKNIKCLVLTLLAVWSTCVIAQDVKKYTFDDNVPLATDWKVETDVPSGGSATCEITNNIGGSLTAKEGNYLGLAYLNKSKITISVTSTAEFKNITSIGLDVAASDNGKPTFSILVVDAGGNTIAALAENLDSKNGFATGGTKKWGHADFAANGVSGYIKILTYASSSGKYAAIDNISITHSAGPAGPVAVTGVTLDKTTISLEAGQTAQLTATIQPGNADNQAVTWSSSDNNVVSVDATGKITANAKGSATITVTTADGGKTATCTVTVTEPAAPVAVTGVTLNKNNTTIYTGRTETLTATIQPADATNKAITWTSDNTGVATINNGVVTGVSVGTATITVKTADGGFSATCTVTVEEAPIVHPTGVSISKTSINLQVGGSETLTATVTPADANNKNVTWSTSDATVAAVDKNGKVTGIKAGNATITATTEDGGKTATCSVTVTAGPPVPSTGLTTHYPEVYEAKDLAGGYNGKLTVFGGREYEVYYVSRDAESNITVATTPVEKVAGVCTSVSENETKAKDGWFTLKTNGTSGSTNGTAKDEFETSIRCAKLLNNQALEMHIKGFDQFSFYGKDNNATESKGRHFEIYIDDVKQAMTPTTEYTIRRFDITTGEHVIRLVGIGGSNNEITSFSLRIAEEPRTKWIKGNDSTQVVMQTTAPKPIYYFTKYNSKGETKLIWDGPEATGITLTTHASGSIGDTLVLGGTANCPTGTYNYHIAAFYNGLETSRANGKFIVASEIKALTDTMVDAYQNEEMDLIQFRYYALSDADVKLTWTGATPAGITGSGSNGKYIIGGTPTTVGTYDFVISVTGGNSIKGKIIVRALDLGNDPVLYLYKNNLAYEQDGIYEYLTSAAGGKKNLIARKAREDGLRPAEQYAKYKWVLISEDVDANNAEVLAIAEGGANLPVLNLKSFTYAPGRLDWGEPDNGSITDNARSITVLRADHPIFASMAGISQGQKIDILSAINKKGLMPAAIDYEGTLCLATAWTRDINNYTGDGVQETFLHEVPAEMRGGKKYICLPIALQSSKNLSANGKKLISSVINYLLSSKATIDLPELKITSFKINGVAGTIDQVKNTINVSFDITKNPTLDLTNIIPEVTVASQLTHAVPNNGEAVDFSKSSFAPVVYVVTDYINRRAYDVTVSTYNPEGIEDIYSVGEWVNIYDIYGRKVTTTNEDIYQMALPRGVYIVVLENGETFKIMR